MFNSYIKRILSVFIFYFTFQPPFPRQLENRRVMVPLPLGPVSRRLLPSQGQPRRQVFHHGVQRDGPGNGCVRLHQEWGSRPGETVSAPQNPERERILLCRRRLGILYLKCFI